MRARLREVERELPAEVVVRRLGRALQRQRQLGQHALRQRRGGQRGGEQPLLPAGTRRRARLGQQHECVRRRVAHVGGGPLVAPLARGARVEDRLDRRGELGARIRVAAQRGALGVEQHERRGAQRQLVHVVAPPLLKKQSVHHAVHV